MLQKIDRIMEGLLTKWLRNASASVGCEVCLTDKANKVVRSKGKDTSGVLKLNHSWEEQGQ